MIANLSFKYFFERWLIWLRPFKQQLFYLLIICCCVTDVQNLLAQTVPVHENFLEVQAVDKTSFVAVQWKVRDNVQIDHYEIERMDIDGVFSTIAFILSDNNELTVVYNYKDKITVRDLHLFYRIKAVDLDGAEMYSAITPLHLQSVSEGLVPIDYVEGANFIKLHLPIVKGSYVFRFYNVVGRMVKTTTVKATEKKIKIDDLKLGSYFIEAFHPQTGKRFYASFVK